MSLTWTCKCGNRPWLHHTECARCFAPKPAEGADNGVKIPPAEQEKPKVNDGYGYCGLVNPVTNAEYVPGRALP